MDNIEPTPTSAPTFDMVAKTFQGLEDILAEEIRALPGAVNVEPGRRSVSFEGTLETMYRANMQCRTALRILKPICTFTAADPDELYSLTKDFDWGTIMDVNSTFSIDSGAVYSDEFTNSRYVTYRVKDAIVDWFQDRLGQGRRPGVRLQDADVNINVHIAGKDVTLSLDSSGESLHKRGYRVAQTEAPINEVLAAGIILRSGWRGDEPFVDPMCGSGTFLIEAAMIAAGIMPGVYRSRFAFESWPDFDRELFESIYDDDSSERTPAYGIYGSDILPAAVAVAERNIKQAGLGKYITLETKDIKDWTEAPGDGKAGVVVTNPPYGERISVDNMEGLYAQIGNTLKNVFKGWHAWIIGYSDDYFNKIGLHPSLRLPILNGKLECELREYIIFDGDLKSFKRDGGSIATTRRPEKRDAKRGPRSDKRFDKEKRPDKERRPDREKRFDNDRPRFDKSRRDDRRPAAGAYSKLRMTRREDESEEDFTRRRHEAALRSITFKRPSLPPAEGEQGMRRRKGWKPKE